MRFNLQKVPHVSYLFVFHRINTNISRLSFVDTLEIARSTLTLHTKEFEFVVSMTAVDVAFSGFASVAYKWGHLKTLFCGARNICRADRMLEE